MEDLKKDDLKKDDLSIVDEVTAEKDFDRWLNTIQSSARVIRDAEKVQKVDIIDAIQSGGITVDADGVLVLKLKYPLNGSRPVSELTFRNRFKTSEIRKAAKKIEQGDNYGMLMAHASVLTGSEVNVIGEFHSCDFNLISAVVGYFL